MPAAEENRGEGLYEDAAVIQPDAEDVPAHVLAELSGVRPDCDLIHPHRLRMGHSYDCPAAEDGLRADRHRTCKGHRSVADRMSADVRQRGTDRNIAGAGCRWSGRDGLLRSGYGLALSGATRPGRRGRYQTECRPPRRLSVQSRIRCHRHRDSGAG